MVLPQSRVLTRRLMFAVSLTVLVTVLGCIPAEQRAYETARAANTEEAFQQYLTQYPQGTHEAAARQAAEDLAWAAAKTGGNREALQHFVSTYPNSPNCAAAQAQLADVDWRAAEQARGEALYTQFAQAHPTDRRANEAKTRAAELAWQAAVHDGSPEAFARFAKEHSDSAYAAEARDNVEGKEISLVEAQRRGWARATVTGQGLSSVELEVRRTVHKRLRVTIPAGTYFVCQGSAQNMVGCKAETAELDNEETHKVSIEASCANFHRPEPGNDDTYSIRASHPSDELNRLLKIIGKNTPRTSVRQVAVWAVTDNPSRGELNEVFRVVGGGPAASDEDYSAAADLLREAGISPSSKRMFR